MMFEIYAELFSDGSKKVEATRKINEAPKVLWGDYDLHIERNSMTITSKNDPERKTESKCHPGDDWNLENGIDFALQKLYGTEVKAGSKVKVVEHGTYTLYEDWLVANHATPVQMMRWDRGHYATVGSIGTVEFVGKHLKDENILLALVEIDDAYYIINTKRLKVIA